MSSLQPMATLRPVVSDSPVVSTGVPEFKMTVSGAIYGPGEFQVLTTLSIPGSLDIIGSIRQGDTLVPVDLLGRMSEKFRLHLVKEPAVEPVMPSSSRYRVLVEGTETSAAERFLETSDRSMANKVLGAMWSELTRDGADAAWKYLDEFNKLIEVSE